MSDHQMDARRVAPVEPLNTTGPAATAEDTPLRAAIRKAFDYPTIANIEAVALEAQRIAAPPEGTLEQPMTTDAEIHCRHCGVDIRFMDGRWLDRETHSTCDFREEDSSTQEHAPPQLSPDAAMDIYVPGNWRCLKCAFVLSQATIFMASGEIGCTRDQVMNLTGETCPNDGEPMVRVTWRERALENQQWGESLMNEIIAATGAEHLPGALEIIKSLRAAAGVHPPQDQAEEPPR